MPARIFVAQLQLKMTAGWYSDGNTLLFFFGGRSLVPFVGRDQDFS
jgi:hypothetical protein